MTNSLGVEASETAICEGHVFPIVDLPEKLLEAGGGHAKAI